MRAMRSLHVKHFQFKSNPHVSQGGEHTRLALRQDGHRIWGPVLYRSTYKSDTDWAQFMRRLQFRTQRFLEISHPPDLVDAFRLTVLEHESAFEGATTSAIRAHFKHWTETAVEDEQGPGTHQKEAQRYRYCVQVDEEGLDTVVRKAPGLEDPYALNTMGYVRVISKDWKPYDPAMYLSGVKYLEDSAAPVEGCTLHDVGWMNVPYDNLVKAFRHLLSSPARPVGSLYALAPSKISAIIAILMERLLSGCYGVALDPMRDDIRSRSVCARNDILERTIGLLQKTYYTLASETLKGRVKAACYIQNDWMAIGDMQFPEYCDRMQLCLGPQAVQSLLHFRAAKRICVVDQARYSALLTEGGSGAYVNRLAASIIAIGTGDLIDGGRTRPLAITLLDKP